MLNRWLPVFFVASAFVSSGSRKHLVIKVVIYPFYSGLVHS